eukprot:28437-Chlamydomonas_euryale.AAC.3
MSERPCEENKPRRTRPCQSALAGRTRPDRHQKSACSGVRAKHVMAACSCACRIRTDPTCE